MQILIYLLIAAGVLLLAYALLNSRKEDSVQRELYRALLEEQSKNITGEINLLNEQRTKQKDLYGKALEVFDASLLEHRLNNTDLNSSAASDPEDDDADKKH